MRTPATLVAALLVLAAGYALWPTTHPAPANAPTAKSSRPATPPFPASTASTPLPDEPLPLTTAAATAPIAPAYQDEASALADRRTSEATETEISDSAGRWARLNPAAAFAWAAALTDERMHNFALGQVLEVWTPAQPREAITAILQSQLPESEHDYRLQQAVATWCMMEPAGAQRWLATLPNDTLKTSLLIAAVDHMNADWATHWLTYAATSPDTASDDRTALGIMLVNALSQHERGRESIR